MSKKLTEQDYANAAKDLKCEVAAIKAVATVESGGRSGFDSKGRLMARFEGHHFRKYTGGKFDNTHPAVSYPYKIQKSKVHDYRAFNEAFELNPNAAMISTSWGMFQPMGAGFEECGFETVDDMLTSYREGEANQLKGFVSQIKARGLADELRRLDWAGFAKNYNGADYKANNYDGKMAAAYKKLKGKSVAADGVIVPPVQQGAGMAGEVPPAPKPDPTVLVPQATPSPAEEPKVSGLKTQWAALTTFVTASAGSIITWLSGARAEIIIGLAVIVTVIGGVYMITRYFKQQKAEVRAHEEKMQRERQAHEVTIMQMKSAMDKDANTVRVVPKPLESSDSQ